MTSETGISRHGLCPRDGITDVWKMDKLAEKKSEVASWTAITEVDTKKKTGRRITRHYAALLQMDKGQRELLDILSRE